jgi:hypothetical protein
VAQLHDRYDDDDDDDDEVIQLFNNTDRCKLMTQFAEVNSTSDDEL